MSNEEKCRDAVSRLLRQHGYEDTQEIIVEKETSDDKKLQRLLRRASKKGPGQGKPDFIIRSRKLPETVIVGECKASVSMHKRAFKEALHYAKFLASKYHVFVLAASGENAEK